MTGFRSLYVKESQLSALQAEQLPPWPAIYRDRVPHLDAATYQIFLQNGDTPAKAIALRQLLTMPSFKEDHRVTSKAGWTVLESFKGLTFQTLFSLFPSPVEGQWVEMTSYHGHRWVIEREKLAGYRIILSCHDQPLPVMHGGPVWVHHFHHYVEYSFPQLKQVRILDGEQTASRSPLTDWGFNPDNPRVEPGQYYSIDRERVVSI